ncbi:hypothetical protein [Bacillus sp. ISL-37]|uniref:hypothetical protein n=1 Tax=Bacillus sp. ISL-37 TaxID=2819123 RepID=UPI001BE9F3DC|nr:hypothetical protein [Bacillus sp. ISL-37]MBT2685217.1 hypothetical protein [Bacillus sp. ISL-37]
MKKLTVSVLSLFILLLLGHGTLPAEKISTWASKSKGILPIEQVHEELPGPDFNEKKIPFILSTVVLLHLTLLFALIDVRVNRVVSLFSFLTAVFFQSNYVIKSP